ncbi:hypothetical protein QA649_37405 [Bradyrhizobium sp. CB1717]|uniref:GAP1-N1 domain-containing protein n=1 Tax=Bradyrhizobium sp. CB1717 TaxID=3039154 RepID=UPI0024B0ED83|nr:hypothetical protein [Bradyrhizobium sp. CB1717]WFU23630.1 hypothetical protein QA649_37405 [Bradyrhizobium sp. CB1717]
MNATAPEILDQALFGYADGHRQIASSLRLPPKDLYLLSIATDLAGGARLGDDESYLSGLPLPESRRYAVFRTWAAPEMPRPGCVWSHVVLLGQKTTASLAAFSTLLPLFRRPDRSRTDEYGEPLGPIDIGSGKAAAVSPIAEIIETYYAGKRVVLPPSGSAADLEEAVLAVWSQQWPRLRATYSFCTAAVKEHRGVDASDYDVQVASPAEPRSGGFADWVAFAASDAAQNRVTPLRRFLWRYGRDISNSRRSYRMLVELFEGWGDADEMPMEAAAEVFESLVDPAEGAILKRDVMGLGTTSPRLIASIPATDFLRLMTSESLPEAPTDAQVARRLAGLKPSQVGVVARLYDLNRESLSPWKETILDAVVEHVDRSTILSDFPESMFDHVLLAREDLVDADTLSKVGNDALLGFPRDSEAPVASRYVLPELLRRNMGDAENRIIAENPDVVFRHATGAYARGSLEGSWLQSFPSFAETILKGSWLDRATSTSELAAALAILRYPRWLSKSSEEISRRLAEMNDDAQGPDRLNMQAALLRAAIDESSSQSWRLIVQVLPQLRPSIVRGQLPASAHAFLKDDLPHFYSAGYWDLDRRILLSLQNLYGRVPNPSALDLLSLSQADRKIVLNEEFIPRNPFSKLWDIF